MGLVSHNTRQNMMWWERERLLTEKDKAAIDVARGQDWAEIDEDSAETVHGRYILHDIIMTKYHNEEYSAGML